jgi:hypothetical protein
MRKITLAIKILGKPLYKILGDPAWRGARSTDLPHASVRHYVSGFKNLMDTYPLRVVVSTLEKTFISNRHSLSHG